MYLMYVAYIAAEEALMSIAVDFPTFSGARAHLKEVFDANAQGRTVTVARDGAVSAVVPLDRLRDYFSRTVSPRVRLAKDGDLAIALMEDRPFVSEGATVSDALEDLVLSLREYAEDWDDHLKDAPNHRDAWALVQLVNLSSDDQLLEWFERGGE